MIRVHNPTGGEISFADFTTGNRFFSHVIFPPGTSIPPVVGGLTSAEALLGDYGAPRGLCFVMAEHVYCGRLVVTKDGQPIFPPEIP